MMAGLHGRPMAHRLPLHPTVTATDIQAMVITLKTNPSDPHKQQSASFAIKVLRSDGSVKTLKGDLVPTDDPTKYVTVGERTALMGFMADLRDRAIEQVLGT